MGTWLLATAGLLASVVGCQPAERQFEWTLRTEPPAVHSVKGFSVLEAGVDATWARLKGRASRDPFRVLASEKQARFAVVELQPSLSGRPLGDFVDCGRIERTVTEDGETERFTYAVVESGRDREVESDGDHYRIRDVDRKVSLSVRTTVFLKPEGDRRTRVTANTRYKLVIEASGHSRRVPLRRSDEAPPAAPFGPERVEISFTSFKEARHPVDESIVCRATGEVERLMLALANPDSTPT